MFFWWQNEAIKIPLTICFGAIAGALSRYYIGLFFKQITPVDYFSFGTLFVNLTGSFLMGLVVSLAAKNFLNVSPKIILMITVGFLGSYTTFSSYELETINLLAQGKKQVSILYWLGSPILGFIAIKLGMILGRVIN